MLDIDCMVMCVRPALEQNTYLKKNFLEIQDNKLYTK